MPQGRGNDGTAQSIGIINQGSGAQFFGLRDFASPISSLTLNNAGDIFA